MVEGIEEDLEDQLFEEFKQELIKEGTYIEGVVENEVELQELWKRLIAKMPETNRKMGILLLSDMSMKGVPMSDILKLIESITKNKE